MPVKVWVDGKEKEITVVELTMLVKDLSIKSLITGDKSAWIKLETLYPGDVTKLAELADKQEVKVVITDA